MRLKRSIIVAMDTTHIHILLISFACSLSVAHLFCSDLLKTKPQRFYPVRHCQRSNQTLIAAKNVGNVEKCAQFATHHEAMAFNYGHGKKPRKKTSQNEFINLFDVMKSKNETKTFSKKPVEIGPYFNCEVLSCPEIGNMSTMINDTRYDYYTLYGNGKFSSFFFYETANALALLGCA